MWFPKTNTNISLSVCDPNESLCMVSSTTWQSECMPRRCRQATEVSATYRVHKSRAFRAGGSVPKWIWWILLQYVCVNSYTHVLQHNRHPKYNSNTGPFWSNSPTHGGDISRNIWRRKKRKRRKRNWMPKKMQPSRRLADHLRLPHPGSSPFDSRNSIYVNTLCTHMWMHIHIYLLRARFAVLFVVVAYRLSVKCVCVMIIKA